MIAGIQMDGRLSKKENKSFRENRLLMNGGSCTVNGVPAFKCGK